MWVGAGLNEGNWVSESACTQPESVEEQAKPTATRRLRPTMEAAWWEASCVARSPSLDYWTDGCPPQNSGTSAWVFWSNDQGCEWGRERPARQPDRGVCANDKNHSSSWNIVVNIGFEIVKKWQLTLHVCLITSDQPCPAPHPPNENSAEAMGSRTEICKVEICWVSERYAG